MVSEKTSPEKFINLKNVVVFQHFNPGEESIKHLNEFINGNDNSYDSFESKVTQSTNEVLDKFNLSQVNKHIKLLYLFFTEGYYSALRGGAAQGQYEKEIRNAMEKAINGRPGLSFEAKVVGANEINPILARVENSVGEPLQKFLLDSKGKGGYDTPKIAAALIQLARLPYSRDEIFIRLDDDVKPNEIGLLKLKEKYFSLLHAGKPKMFCISWNYEAAAPQMAVDPFGGPDYDALFRYFANAFSIRTTYFTPSCKCNLDSDLKINFQSEPEEAVTLDLLSLKYFIDLFKLGHWGSDLVSDPISGAGLCFSPESLKELPPWCNADELITWIDDMVRRDLMSLYYQDGFDVAVGLLVKESGRGFIQHRNNPEEFNVKNVKWSVENYLDRLLMGCILAFAVNPGRYDTEYSEGFGSLLRESSYTLVKWRWESGLRKKLHEGALLHARAVLSDWCAYFCRKAIPVEPGRIVAPPKAPDGFAPAPPETPFNIYTIRQLMQMDSGKFDLVDRVFGVLNKYLELKYEFWPHVVDVLDNVREKQLNKPSANQYSWLFLKPPSKWKADDYPVPTRVSRASYALIMKMKPKNAENQRWLLQWNEKWQVMNLIAGHREVGDPNELTCLIREIHEELFSNLSISKLTEMQQALKNEDEFLASNSTWDDEMIESIENRDDLEYVAYSGSARTWSQYELAVYEVHLKDKVRIFMDDAFYTPGLRSAPKAVNEWVSIRDIGRGYTPIGRPISPTVIQVFKLRGLISESQS